MSPQRLEEARRAGNISPVLIPAGVRGFQKFLAKADALSFMGDQLLPALSLSGRATTGLGIKSMPWHYSDQPEGCSKVYWQRFSHGEGRTR